MQMAMQTAVRRRTVGVEVQPQNGAHARVWAPACSSVDVVIDGGAGRWSLEREPGGYFAGTLRGAAAGDRYWFELNGRTRRPDPASRCQPEGPHGPSAIVDPAAFAWTDAAWAGVRREGQIVYEMHVGTFTQEGTWNAARAQLESLADLGITVMEMMPVADFAGRHGWGYDGVNLYAPTRLYGTPDELRAFVDRAHALKMGVILDVVYNHVGPDGNYLADFSPDYFTDRYTNDWGEAINFETSAPARAFFVENAAYWIDEFHFDGLRLDATQDIHDASKEHVVAEMIRTARATAGSRSIFVVAENEPQETALVRQPAEGGYGGDALWNDDYHHTGLVALTGRREAYYLDYNGSPQEFISAAKYGYLYQGQWYGWQRQSPRDARTGSAAEGVRQLSREPRSGCEHAVRATAAPGGRARPSSRVDRAHAARPGDADVVSGPGVRGVGAVSVLRGPQAGARGAGLERTARVPVAVPECDRSRRDGGASVPA